ncbi:lipase [Pseudoalteromonas rubra]|uniref:lipase n=1 Tax=Pseudoalteromonas rubra TaxID=43658 RepID=UPI000F79B13F|nr:lipase [Pseudoalteromonas rubra]
MLNYMKVIFIILTLTLSGCMSSNPYRTEFKGTPCIYKVKDDCSDSALTKRNLNNGKSYHLAFIEFDDQGRIHNPMEDMQRLPPIDINQKNKILDYYSEIAAKEDVLLLTFVHGWHHNAQGSPEDGNIISFREMLSQAATVSNKHVLGVYIGWRGDSFRLPIWSTDIDLFNWVTFWERKNTAHQIGTQGLSTLLLELEDMLKHTGENDTTSMKRDHKMISIGHSFGGAALYSAISPILESRYIASRPFNGNRDNQIVEGFGDLVVLLNPAFEAIKYDSLFHLAQDKCRSYPSSQRPKLVTVSSPNDLAVRWLFPTGRRINAFFENHRDVNNIHCIGDSLKPVSHFQSKSDRLAIGHYQAFISHSLKTSDDAVSAFEAHDDSKTRVSIWESQAKLGRFTFSGSILEANGITRTGNPYYNIWTEDKKIINGHNDVWTIPLKQFLYDLVYLTVE